MLASKSNVSQWANEVEALVDNIIDLLKMLCQKLLNYLLECFAETKYVTLNKILVIRLGAQFQGLLYMFSVPDMNNLTHFVNQTK